MPLCHFACGNCMKLPNWLKMIRWGVGAALPVPSIWIPKCNYDAITTQNPKAQYPRVTKKFRLVIFFTSCPWIGPLWGKTMGRNHDFLMNQFGPFHPVIFHCTTQRKPQGIADEPEGITCRKKCLTCRSAELFEDRRLYVFLYVYFDICLIYLNLLILILHSSFLLCFFLSLCLSLCSFPHAHHWINVARPLSDSRVIPLCFQSRLELVGVVLLDVHSSFVRG